MPDPAANLTATGPFAFGLPAGDAGVSAATSPASSPSQALELLQQLREQLLNGVATTYAGHLSAARRDLRQLGERTAGPELRDLYESAHGFISNSGLSLLTDFQRNLNSDFDSAVATLTGQAKDAWDVASELCLVDAEDFERDLAVGKLAAKATYACSQQLIALDRRLAALLGIRRLDIDSNPLSPRRLFQAFLSASGGSWAGEQLSLVLLETFEHYTARELPGLYQQLNQCLIDEGVLPQLPAVAEDGTELLSGRTGSGGDAGAGISDVFVQLTGGLSQARYGAGAGASLAGLGAAFAPLVLGQFITGLTATPGMPSWWR